MLLTPHPNISPRFRSGEFKLPAVFDDTHVTINEHGDDRFTVMLSQKVRGKWRVVSLNAPAVAELRRLLNQAYRERNREAK